MFYYGTNKNDLDKVSVTNPRAHGENDRSLLRSRNGGSTELHYNVRDLLNCVVRRTLFALDDNRDDLPEILHKELDQFLEHLNERAELIAEVEDQ